MHKFYLTTPIFYVNSHPHLGHLYVTLVADSIARYRRQRDFDTYFLTGTDEHGQNIERAAAARGLAVKDHVDTYVAEFKEVFAQFNISNNHWIRTTDSYHAEGVAKLWRIARDAGFIYKDRYEGWYCVGCNLFQSEEEWLMGEDGIPLCRIHERPLDRLAEDSYFFKLSAFQERLLEHYERHPEFIQPESRRNEVISFVRGGLQDLAVSRVSVRWGIPVPDDPEHTIYVWFDALTNYITAVGYGNETQGGESQFTKYWPADLHLVGKDILRFHAVYWPAFLMATGIALPKTVYAHGLWISGGRKMSKSLGNVIDLEVLRRHFTPDAVRFFCLREMVFGLDGDFTYEALIDRTNGDLAAGLGNLSSRTLTMVRNYFAGRVPDLIRTTSVFASQLDEVRATIEATLRDFDTEFESYNFSRAIEATWAAITCVDKLISAAKPWDLAKDPERRSDLAQVIATAIEGLRHLTVVLSPVLPESTQSIWEQLGGTGTVASINPRNLVWGSACGDTIGEIKPVFPRLEKQKIMEEIKQEEAASQAARTLETQPPATEPPPGVAYIGIEDFAKIELRAGEILTAERIPKADKLLKMTIDLGEETPRQILAGIAQYYEPEKLVGRKVIVVANLAPRKMRGLESQGMILAASIGEEGRPVLAGFIEEVPNGVKLR